MGFQWRTIDLLGADVGELYGESYLSRIGGGHHVDFAAGVDQGLNWHVFLKLDRILDASYML